MNVRRLSYFIKVAEDGSLTRTASSLRVAQPALSRQIRLLEEDMGVSLFSRTKRGMQLTEEGRHLHAVVSAPLRELEKALRDFQSFTSGVEGGVTIGIPPALGEVFARSLVLRANAELPSIRLGIVEAHAGPLANFLGRGLIDFALIEGVPDDQRLAISKAFSEQLVLVGPANSDLAPNRPVTFREAAKLPLILSCHHFGIRAMVDEAAAKSRVTLNIRMEVDSTQLSHQFVESHLGYAILPPSYLVGSNRGLKTARIIEPALDFCVYFAQRGSSVALRTSTLGIDGSLARIVSEVLGGSSKSDGLRKVIRAPNRAPASPPRPTFDRPRK